MSDLPIRPIDRRRARCVAVVLGLAALGAFAAALATQAPGDRVAASETSHRVDPIGATLLRCQGLGDRALADADCRAGWAEHRRRFLAREARP